MNKNDDSDFEIRFFEGILKKKPDFIEALAALGELYTKQGLYEEGLRVDKKLSRLKGDDPIVLYNLACSYSLTQQVGHALRVLKKAIARGYDDFAYLDRDKDLANLRRSDRFKKYIEAVKQKKRPAPAHRREK